MSYNESIPFGNTSLKYSSKVPDSPQFLEEKGVITPSLSLYINCVFASIKLGFLVSPIEW